MVQSTSVSHRVGCYFELVHEALTLINVQELAAMLKVLPAPLVVQLGMVVHPSRGPNSTGYASVYMWLSSRPHSLFYRASGRFRES